MNQLSDLVSQAMALLDAEPELYRMADDMHRHFVGEALDANPRELIPGLVLRWLHCACDLELWQEGLSGSPARGDIDRTLDFVARLEDLGVEPVGEQRCIDCDHRKRCV